MYKHICQICLTPVEGKRNGLISIGAHIEPLGHPHNGPDDASNMLCLCPNHHSMFDDYGFTIDDDLSINIKGALPMNTSKLLHVDKKTVQTPSRLPLLQTMLSQALVASPFY